MPARNQLKVFYLTMQFNGQERYCPKYYRECFITNVVKIRVDTAVRKKADVLGTAIIKSFS